jgi:hypothetical protein
MAVLAQKLDMVEHTGRSVTTAVRGAMAAIASLQTSAQAALPQRSSRLFLLHPSLENLRLATGERAIENRAKQFLGLAIEPFHLHLLDWREVNGASIDCDPG